MSEEFEEKKREAFLELVEIEEQLDLKFDMHAQDINDWSWIQKIVPGLIITSAGGIVPFQAEGLIQGLPFYYRERHGGATLRVAGADHPNAYGPNSLYHSGVEVEEFRSGLEWISTLLNLIEALKKSEFLYDFKGSKVDADHDGVKDGMTSLPAEDIYSGWGHNESEAYEYAVDSSDDSNIMLLLHGHYGWEKERVMKLVELRNIQPGAINSDDRIFPNPEPVFLVNVPSEWRHEDNLIEIPQDFWKQ